MVRGWKFSRWQSRAALAAICTAVFGTALTGTANAQGLGDFVGASECFSTAPPSATVYAVLEPGFGVGLLCGDPTRGVIHIDQGHPIAEDGSDDETIPRCMFNILTRSDRYEIAPSNPRYEGLQIRRPSGGTATIIYDPENGQVVTMFTSGDLGNDWAACAAFTQS